MVQGCRTRARDAGLSGAGRGRQGCFRLVRSIGVTDPKANPALYDDDEFITCLGGDKDDR